MDKSQGERVMAKQKEVFEDVELMPGALLSHTFFEKKENRIYSILFKGFMVYLISMGSIGFYLSAFDIEYNALFCHVAIFLMAIVCALLYYRLMVENIGYLLLLGAFALLVFTYKLIINSGFYAVVNITVEKASNYFEQDIQKLYTEQVSDRYLTITMVVLFIGVVLDILLNVYISRRMQYVTAIFIVMGLNMIPLYITEEPNNLYVIMFLAGISMAYVFKSGKHYGQQVSVKRNDYIFESKKKEISYKSDIKIMLQTGAVVAGFIIIAVNSITAFKPKNEFNIGYEVNEYKQQTMEVISQFLLEGFDAFRGGSNDTGGLMGGTLGDVSSVKLDYQTDLQIRFAPYSYETLYLKSFVGVRYNPYENIWTSMHEMKGYPDYDYAEGEALKNAYDEGNLNTTKSFIKILPVDFSGEIKPYYVVKAPAISTNGWMDYYFYPRLIGNDTIVSPESYHGSAYYEEDLYIPVQNYETIAKTVAELPADAYESDEAFIAAVKNYFQEEYPYTIKPGKTPGSEDFINYFLNKKKKGYCAHYASAAVLMFRYMGIPARYVEGYAVDYYQVTMGELMPEANYSYYHSGYSAIGDTAVVEVNVTDADAHAWVEVYDKEKGWYVVDVTPTGEVEEIEEFWSAFDGSESGEASSDISDGVTGVLGFKVPAKVIKGIWKTIAVIVVVIIGAYILLKLIKLLLWLIKLKCANINDRLIMKYSRKCARLRKHNKGFADCVNYKQQLEYFGIRDEQLLKVLEKAGFSKELISKDEYDIVTAKLKEMTKFRQREQNATGK